MSPDPAGDRRAAEVLMELAQKHESLKVMLGDAVVRIEKLKAAIIDVKLSLEAGTSCPSCDKALGIILTLIQRDDT